MKVRGTTVGVKLTALCWGALTLIAPVALAACTSSSSTAPTIPSFSPTVSVSGSVSVSASAGNSGTSPSDGSSRTSASGTPSASSSTPSTVTPRATQTVTQTATPTVTATATSTATPVPTAAPVTGGGGTAGFQDTLLLVAGVAAIAAGAGSIFYRRRINRGR